jgi:hypothetical protein
MRRVHPFPVRSAAAPIAALALAASIPLAHHRSVSADTVPTLTATAGLRGWHDPGDHVVVTAVVESSSFFAGRIDVVAPSGAVSSRAVEVAGGTSKKVQVVVLTPFDPQSIQVRLVDDDDPVATRSLSLRAAYEVELVGVMPAMATRAGKVPEQVSMASDTGGAQLEPIDPDLLALGPAALDVYDTIVAASTDVNALTDDQLPALLGWLNRGGRLVVDDDGTLTALPADWRPGVAGYSWAGRGEVHVRAGRASQGEWASLIEPSGSSVNDSSTYLFGPGPVDIQRELARRAGVELPSLTPLLIPLILYWLVVSVVLFVVLKLARRMTLAWVAIPLLAVLTASGVVVYGNHWRSAGEPTASVFVDGYPGGGVAQLTALTFTRRGGTARVQLPANWHSDSEINPSFGSASVLRTTASGEATVFSASLEPGQVATATLSGDTDDTGLVVRAEVDPEENEVTGTITNRGTSALFDVAVFSKGGGRELGTLQPGESAEFAIDADPLPLGIGIADRVWRRRFDADGVSVAEQGSSLVEFGVWDLASSSINLHPSGLVRAAGWTDQRSSDARNVSARSVVTVTAPISPSGGVVHPASVRAARVRDPFGPQGNFNSDTVLRYLLPATADQGAPLLLALPIGLDSVEVWTGSGWEKASAQRRTAILPTGAVRSGVVLARIVNDGNFFPQDDTLPSLRSATGEDLP